MNKSNKLNVAAQALVRREHKATLDDMTRKYVNGWDDITPEELMKCKEAVEYFEYYLGDREMKTHYSLRSNLGLGLITKPKK